MESSPTRLQQLWSKHLTSSTSEIEEAELNSYISDPMYASAVKKLISEAFDQHQQNEPLESTKQQAILASIYQNSQRPKTIKLWPKIAITAACVVIVAGTIFYLQTNNRPADKPIMAKVEDAAAGRDAATLTLANGQQIQLDSAATGTIAQQQGVTITKAANGQLIYNLSPSGSGSSTLQYNTITTPNGGQFKIYLPDGSMAFLNAASSLRYATTFSGNERRVEITGEGYFEITKNPNKPFRVISKNQILEVLGTHFNVASYEDEPTVTTLAEGSVKVTTNNDRRIILRPDQQSTVNSNGATVSQVQASDVTAWTEGLFVFNKTDLKSVLKQIGRWYSVSVDYSTIPDIKLDAEIPRNISLLKVLQLIEAASEVPLKLEERRIMRK